MNLKKFLEGEQAKRAQKALESAKVEQGDLAALMQLVGEVARQNEAMAQQRTEMAARIAALESRAPDVRTEVHEITVEPKLISDRPAGWDVTIIRGEDGLITGMKMVAL